MNTHMGFLKREDCVLLLVDIQKTLFDLCVDNDLVQKHVAALIDICRMLDVPIVITQQNPEKIGPFIPELVERAEDALVFDKMEFSCFQNEATDRAIASLNRRTILLAGIETHICICQTGLDAVLAGYRVHAASDAITCRSLPNKVIGLDRLAKAGVVMSSTEMIIFELLNRAGTPEFREALPVLKTL